jgi:hypothetical protein
MPRNDLDPVTDAIFHAEQVADGLKLFPAEQRTEVALTEIVRQLILLNGRVQLLTQVVIDAVDRDL